MCQLESLTHKTHLPGKYVLWVNLSSWHIFGPGKVFEILGYLENLHLSHTLQKCVTVSNRGAWSGGEIFRGVPLWPPLFTPLRLSDKNRAEFFMRTFGKSPGGVEI